MIEVKNITLKYSNGKGIFDLNFKIKKGQVYGYIGPIGAGKTTTVQMLLGFKPPYSGSASIAGLNCSKEAHIIQNILGYVSGEPSFFERMKINEYLIFVENLRKTKDEAELKQKETLIDWFELNTKERIEYLSNEDRQKLAIITGFMHDPEIYILDEPTKNLNPLMQTRFMDLILQEKKRGKTIFFTSDCFEEAERICDQVAIVKEGRILEKNEIIAVKSKEVKSYLVKFGIPPKTEEFIRYGFGLKQFSEKDYEIFAPGDRIDILIKLLSHEKILVFNSNLQALEENFTTYFGKEASKA